MPLIFEAGEIRNELFLKTFILNNLISILVEKAMAPHSSTLAWKIPWTEEPGRLQSMGSRRVGHDWATSLSLFTFCIGGGNGNPLQCSCLENPMDRGAWWAAVYGVTQSRTRLKRLSSSSSSSSINSRFLSFSVTLNRVDPSLLLSVFFIFGCLGLFIASGRIFVVECKLRWPMGCVLVPQPGMEPVSSALQGDS